MKTMTYDDYRRALAEASKDERDKLMSQAYLDDGIRYDQFRMLARLLYALEEVR